MALGVLQVLCACVLALCVSGSLSGILLQPQVANTVAKATPAHAIRKVRYRTTRSNGQRWAQILSLDKLVEGGLASASAAARGQDLNAKDQPNDLWDAIPPEICEFFPYNSTFDSIEVNNF